MLIISDGQALPKSTAAGGHVSSNPTAETQSGSEPLESVPFTTNGQALATSTVAGGQILSSPTTATQSGSEPVASVLIISDGQVPLTSTAFGGQLSPNPTADSLSNSGRILTTIKLLGSPTAPAQAASTSTLQTIIEGHTIQLVGTNSGIVVDSTLLQPGETTTIGTVPISVGTGFFQANSQMVSLPGSAELVNAELITSLDSGELFIGSTTLTAGGVAIATLGHTYSVGTDGLVQDGKTISTNDPLAATVLANGGVAIGSETLSVGGAAITTLGHTYSVGSAGLVQDGTTISPNTPADKDSDVVTVLANGAVIVGSTTLSAGGAAITTFEHTYSVASGGLIRDGTMIPTNAPSAAKDSDPLSVIGNGIVIVGSTILTAGGPAITTLGHTISVASSGVVRDGTTIPVSMWLNRSVDSLTTSGAVAKATGTSGKSVLGSVSSSVSDETTSSSLTASSDLAAASATAAAASARSLGQRLSPTFFIGVSIAMLLGWLM